MSKVTDVTGAELSEGDYLITAHSFGSSARLSFGKVSSVELLNGNIQIKNQGGHKSRKNPSQVVKITAEQFESRNR